jgi:UDP-N-acetylmuramate dehydrogenase
MPQPVITPDQVYALQTRFGDDLLLNESMKRYTVMQVGGRADYIVIIRSGEELENTIRFLWKEGIPFLLLGGGSNTLISDAGIREVVVINESKEIIFMDEDSNSPLVKAESGASFGNLARRTASKGFGGLEWASSIPGTVGGAVVNNAGAFGSNVAERLVVAEILHPIGEELQRSEWSVGHFNYEYRTSVIKTGEKPAVVLSTTFQLAKSTPEFVKQKITSIAEKRQASQPQGASLGSMFKNPPGDYSGRLIEESGLKGTSVGDAVISDVHANFFINRGNATAADIAGLIALVRDRVADRFGVELELEIQFIGDWSNYYS